MHNMRHVYESEEILITASEPKMSVDGVINSDFRERGQSKTDSAFNFTFSSVDLGKRRNYSSGTLSNDIKL